MFDSGLINKIQKARTYAEEPERIHIRALQVDFDGDHKHHAVEFEDGHWRCDCEYFRGHPTCSHVLAMDRVLGAVAPHES